ncbi:MAG: hypothetical protein V4622_07170 [Bacteroidota bacterium]
MKKFILLILITSSLTISCKKTNSTPDEAEVEKLSFPGRVKSIGSQKYYYNSKGDITYYGVTGDDWTTFYWDFNAKTLRILDEGDFSGVKSDITYIIDSNNYILQSLDGKEKLFYDSLMQLTSNISNTVDTAKYEWLDGNVISKTKKTYSINGTSALDASYIYTFEYSNTLETRNLGMKYFPETSGNPIGFTPLCKNLCTKITLNNITSGEVKIWNYSYEFNSSGKISKATSSGTSTSSETYTYY